MLRMVGGGIMGMICDKETMLALCSPLQSNLAIRILQIKIPDQ